MTLSDPLTDSILDATPYCRGDAPYSLVAVTGEDSADFLQRLCSQDVLTLQAGQAAPAAFFDGKGKLLATAICLRTEAGFLLETQRHQQQVLLALLDRYLFTERVELAAAGGHCVERIDRAAADGCSGGVQEGVVRFVVRRHGVATERWHAADAAGLPRPDGSELTAELGEAVRMMAGFVKVGVESEASTLGLEANLDDHCSTSKGCYTGQEVVARIHTYGHTNRSLRLLRLSPGPAIERPVVLIEPEDELAVGRVMHAVVVGDCRLGVGYLPHDYSAAGSVLQIEGGGEAVVVGW